MAVTELALLRLKQSSTPPNLPSVLAKLRSAATQQAKFSGYPVTLLHCIEDADAFYLIGGWQSVAQHMEEWIPGPTNQELMSELKEGVDVRWMFHVGVGTGEVSGVMKRVSADETGHGDGKREKEGTGVVAVGRYFATDRKRFEGVYAAGVDALEKRVLGGNGGLAGGWREDVGFEAPDGEGEKHGDSDIGKDRDLNEFVLLTAWNSVQEHLDFAKTEDFQRWAGIKEFMSGAEIQHGRALFFVEP